ncbi:hypothetical protein F2P81_002808 [Scophthalmus maximus]|uniref:Uncharacterized protein n=1 Tax=Scophthalmus maximus TaxID=52904 RepID=A0A6A4TN75_SCOMX|nr:hypothetical protein F2P81_002808 [Scophthalmus maximus]
MESLVSVMTDEQSAEQHEALPFDESSLWSECSDAFAAFLIRQIFYDSSIETFYTNQSGTTVVIPGT